jgi:hypothetical protein|tara:strand:+ start:374 stop:682 length:309 start_codon:yes stop_codon:yes gene_type:complete
MKITKRQLRRIIREAWADKGVDLVQFIIDNIQAESNPTGAVDWDTDELYEFLEKEGWTEAEIDFAVEDPRVGEYFDKLEGLYSAKEEKGIPPLHQMVLDDRL